MAGKAQRQWPEGAGHIAATGRKQRGVNPGALLSFSSLFSFSPGPQPMSGNAYFQRESSCLG